MQSMESLTVVLLVSSFAIGLAVVSVLLAVSAELGKVPQAPVCCDVCWTLDRDHKASGTRCCEDLERCRKFFSGSAGCR